MYRKKFSLLLILAVVFYVSGPTVNIAWDAVDGAVSYTIMVVRETGEITHYATADTTCTIVRTGAGRYIVQVSGIDSSGETGATCFSTHPQCATLQTGSSGAWEIQWNPDPPGAVEHR